ncbi:MAG: metalloregulator ArsR/SmtB family transcription factor [Desulfosporosinus sp.]|nr:metalloregulator ArsR/SmtB family transcription factor [Desulfosporosinus sp.]
MELLQTLKIIADDTRFKIIQLLLVNDFCVGALARNLGISEAAVSQHIQILRKGGFLKGEKRGYWTHYSVERSLLIHLAEGLEELANQPTAQQFVCLRESLKNIKSKGGENKMCQCKCEHPEKLQGKPGDCSKELKKECHGEEAHSCEKKVEQIEE